MRYFLLTLSLLLHLSLSAQLVKSAKNYHGSFDVAVGPCLLGDHRCQTSVSASMTHGYQANPYLFVGVGFNVNTHLKKNELPVTYLPFFGDLKVNFTKSKVSPYVDLRCGYSFFGYAGLYVDPSVGVAYCLSVKQSLSFAISCNMQVNSAPLGDIAEGSNGCFNLMFRLSYDF